MARSWLVDSKGFARKVKNASQLCTYQIKDCGASRKCPNCHHHIDNSDVSVEWPGLPAGVKFDPSDVELLEHLAGKVGFGDAVPHLFIDEFIPTLEGDEGICYTHPENLPGAKKDGSSVHFFHRTSKAYATGHRKRRKINGHSSSIEEHVRWHKTGKTKAVIENGAQKGCKKIMVLYKSSKKGFKPDKSNWVMHQYHLGTKEDETDSEFVVSKIFYQQQPKQIEKQVSDPAIGAVVGTVNRASPTTPNTYTPHPPRQGKRAFLDDIDEEFLTCQKLALHDGTYKEDSPNSFDQIAEHTAEATQPPPAAVALEAEQGEPECLAGESQVAEDLDSNMDSLLLCNEYGLFDAFRLENDTCFFGSTSNKNDMLKGDSSAVRETKQESNTAFGISDLGKLESETPPDFDYLDLANLQFLSQESISAWFDRCSEG